MIHDEYDDDSVPAVRAADEAYEIQAEIERQEAAESQRVADSVHKLFLIAAHGIRQELHRAMCQTFGSNPLRAR